MQVWVPKYSGPAGRVATWVLKYLGPAVKGIISSLKDHDNHVCAQTVKILCV